MVILDPILSQIGDWNPQLFRELKGKFKLRNLIICGLIALIFQVLFVAFYAFQLPDPDLAISRSGNYYNQFCYGFKEYSIQPVFLCDSPLKINWQSWWLVQFRALSWSLPALIAPVGGAFLVIDIAQESSRGTLNFIRLSPQSGRSILWGKLLGVPALIYLITLLILPLHLVAAIGAGVSPLFLLSFYLILGLGYILLYSLALLFGLMVGSTGVTNQLNNPTNAGTAVGFLYVSAIQGYMFLNSVTTWSKFNQYLYGNQFGLDVQWFQASISNNFWAANGFAIASVVLVTKGIWYALERKFNTPSRPILSKRQGYICLTFFQVFVLGFLVRQTLPMQINEVEFKTFSLTLLNVLNYLAFLSLIILLTPQRQVLMDWLRYRHLELDNSNRRKSLWQDLIWHESSPAVVAIGICGLISALIILPWATWNGDLRISLSVLVITLSQLLAFVLYALVYQALGFWAKNKRQQTQAIAIFIFLVVLPPIALLILPLPKFLWVIAGYPAVALVNYFELSFNFLIGITAQLGTLSLLGLRLKRTLNEAAQSEMQQLLVEVILETGSS